MQKNTLTFENTYPHEFKHVGSVLDVPKMAG